MDVSDCSNEADRNLGKAKGMPMSLMLFNQHLVREQGGFCKENDENPEGKQDFCRKGNRSLPQTQGNVVRNAG